MPTLPIAVIVPHAGLDIPPEMADRLALSEVDIFNEADIYTDFIFDYRDRVSHWLRFPYARVLIDVNRPDQADLLPDRVMASSKPRPVTVCISSKKDTNLITS